MPQQKKRKQQRPGRFLSILILIFAVLVVFEGKLLINIFSKETLQTQVNSQVDDLLAKNTSETETETTHTPAVIPKESEPETKSETPAVKTPPQLDSNAVVPTQRIPVDDSFFSDAVFIGDSRMEGFRNASGLTQGTFLTGVGMNVKDIFTTKYISMYNEQITVFQALYNNDYKKVYIMLGTNDLGEPDFNDFKESYRVSLGEIQKLLPNAAIYVLSVIYVEESKVTTGEYVNNTNIDLANEKIVELCEENNYHYLNVNEVLSDGNHSLIADASSDGVHLFESYCKIWLNYLKTHYLSGSAGSTDSISDSSAESETESSTQETTSQSESSAASE